MDFMEYANNIPYIIAGAVYGAAVSGLLFYGYLKSRPKYSRKEVERAFRRAIATASFEKEYLAPLAANLAVRGKTPEEEFGEDIDVTRIPHTFNPFGEIVEEYYSRNEEQRDMMKRKLNKLVGKYMIRRRAESFR